MRKGRLSLRLTGELQHFFHYKVPLKLRPVRARTRAGIPRRAPAGPHNELGPNLWSRRGGQRSTHTIVERAEEGAKKSGGGGGGGGGGRSQRIRARLVNLVAPRDQLSSVGGGIATCGLTESGRGKRKRGKRREESSCVPRTEYCPRTEPVRLFGPRA